MTFSEKIKEVRLSKSDAIGRSYSQEDCARLCNVSLSTWRNWEHGRSKPHKMYLKEIGHNWPELFILCQSENKC